jgi:hypothetical protein
LTAYLCFHLHLNVGETASAKVQKVFLSDVIRR